jgi:hypothetical protein
VLLVNRQDSPSDPFRDVGYDAVATRCVPSRVGGLGTVDSGPIVGPTHEAFALNGGEAPYASVVRPQS